MPTTLCGLLQAILDAITTKVDTELICGQPVGGGASFTVVATIASDGIVTFADTAGAPLVEGADFERCPTDNQDIIDAINELAACICCPDEEVTEQQVFTLFSKFPTPHPDASSYPGIAHVGTLLGGGDPGANSTHPGGAEQGNDINGWNVFQVCASALPADDSNNHYWLAGAPSTFAGSLTYSGTPAADLTC